MILWAEKQPQTTVTLQIDYVMLPVKFFLLVTSPKRTEAAFTRRLEGKWEIWKHLNKPSQMHKPGKMSKVLYLETRLYHCSHETKKAQGKLFDIYEHIRDKMYFHTQWMITMFLAVLKQLTNITGFPQTTTPPTSVQHAAQRRDLWLKWGREMKPRVDLITRRFLAGLENTWMSVDVKTSPSVIYRQKRRVVLHLGGNYRRAAKLGNIRDDLNMQISALWRNLTYIQTLWETLFPII